MDRVNKYHGWTMAEKRAQLVELHSQYQEHDDDMETAARKRDAVSALIDELNEEM